MSEILFLSHRIPYPPNKGDKIRSYHFLRALCARHQVHLGTFVDDPADWPHVPALQAMCGESCIRPLRRQTGRLRSLRGLLCSQALSIAWYRDGRLRRWVRELSVQRRLQGAFVFSSAMGPYLRDIRLPAGAARVIDFCDVDSDKWRQYAESTRFPMRQIYRREARLLARAEQEMIREFDATLVTSGAEAELLGGTDGRPDPRVRVVTNGVDTAYFDPTAIFRSPFPADARAIVFTGAMDYYPNVDGVCWFAREVFPLLRQDIAAATFVVVGANPTPEVRALTKLPGVRITGRVEDVRPHLAHASVVVAPLRIARGIQNKVLEALAMDRPVVATDNAVQGIPHIAEAGVAVESEPARFAQAVAERMNRPWDRPAGRAFVRVHYDWDSNLAGVISLFDGFPDQSREAG